MNPDLLLCQTRSRCNECHWSGVNGCALLAALEGALPAPPPPPPVHSWSEAGLVFDDGARGFA